MAKKDDYRAYLRSEEWAVIRAKVYKDAGGLCVFCQAPAEAAHHRYYPENLEDDTPAGKWVVCDRCHRALHGIQEHTPRERAENTVTRAMVDFAADHNLPVDKVVQYTNRILLIMARYHAEVK